MACRFALLALPCLLLATPPGVAQEWTIVTVEMPYTSPDSTPAPGRDGKIALTKEGKVVNYKLALQLPPGIKLVRGILIGGATFTSNEPVRAALAEKSMGLLSYGNPDGFFYYFTCGSGPRLERDLKALAEKCGHPEVAFAPLMTIGYSASTITCRNVAYWNPDRVIGIMHLKGGNLQAHIQEARASLAGVPYLAVNGECEQYGPDGGDTGAGHLPRARYSLDPVDKKKDNQTQWVMIRMQLIERRRRNENNLMGLLVQHTLGRSRDHTDQDPAFYPVLAQFIRSTADARIPKGDPDGKTPVKCLPLKAQDGWLVDADIKAPRFAPARYADYKGDRTLAFWYVDKALVDAVEAYHRAKPWAFADPTAAGVDAGRALPAWGWPGRPDPRFQVVEEMLKDVIDLPDPPVLAWTGGDGDWLAAAAWGSSPAPKHWDPLCGARFAGKPATVTLSAPVAARGLELGAGTTLALGHNRLTVNGHAALAPGSAITATLLPDGRGDRACRLHVLGNLDLAGTLTLAAEGAQRDLQVGDYIVVRGNCKITGAFDKVVAPAGYAATARAGVVTLRKAVP